MGKRAFLDEARAQADYENGTEPVTVLAERHRVSRSTFLTRAKEGGWTRKHNVIRRSIRSKAEMEAARLEDAKRLLSASLTGRLLLAIDRKMQEIEKRMNAQAEAAAPQSAADIERDARAMNTLMQAYARVKELDAQARRDGKRSDQRLRERNEPRCGADPPRPCGPDMSDVTSDSFAVAFGDFQRGYLVVDRAGIRVLRDPYSAKPYVLFYTTKRVGGGVQDFDAIKLLKFGTS